MDIHSSISRNNGPGLYEFLMEAELQHYYSGIRGDLKVQNTAQLKYVTEEDLTAIGMSKPEMRRLKKFFQKHFPQNYLSKFKKMLLSKREDSIPDTLSILSEERPERPPIRVPNKHMIPADAIIVNKELGTGEFGVVQQGVWTNDGERIQVAIKCLSRERMQNNPIEFLKEAAIMHTIDHEHIVRLYGVVLDTNSLMLVTELAPLRSLLECLKEPSLRASFPVSSLCDFAVQIADGMQYLEAKRLIHRDLAARNILVYSKNKVKISDFGLSRALGVGKDYYQTNFNVNLKLPIAWCAPECISYLKFTSASDVWAYGVTLWEMFSYGFQPWAALTGHQIHEAINEPNYQRLEQPDCCPKEHFDLMLNCWQHDPAKRPKFSELISVLPDMKPEQVQAVQDCNEIGQLAYRQGDVITVLDKASNNTMWKGVLNNGKTGFFNPAHTIAYLGSNLPSNKPAEFMRGDGKNAFSSQRRKIRTDMISSPQGDLKHTGHVGLDGAYFGDVSFLAGKYPHLPRQVVTPYKPQEDITDNSSQHLTLERRNTEDRDYTRERNCQPSQSDMQNKNDGLWSDACSETSHMETADMMKQSMNSCMMSSTDTIGPDHEYHEISDEENQDSPLRFDKPLSFDFGPSLLDEMDQMFKSLGSSPLPPATNHSLSSEHESSNARNELREMQAKQSSKKKQATVSPINVKPISAADQKTLYSAIAMAQELTARSMTDLEHPLESPRTPASPSRRRKFSFKLPHQHSPKPDRRHFAEEAASIPDIQATLTDEAKEVYNSLVETPTMETSADANPLRMLRSGLPIVRPRVRGNKHATLQPKDVQLADPFVLESVHHSGAKTLPKIRVPPMSHMPPPPPTSRTMERHYSIGSEIENNPNQANMEDNPIPLPPRDRSKTFQSKSNLTRHQRKHPLILPKGALTRTLAKMAAVTAPSPVKDEVDGTEEYAVMEPNVSHLPSKEFFEEPPTVDNDLNSPDDFENRIAYELAALDSLPADEKGFSSPDQTVNDSLEFPDTSSKPQSSAERNAFDDEEPAETVEPTPDYIDPIKEQQAQSSQPEPTLDDDGLMLPSIDLTRQSDHVSCEDLLEFACDGPNTLRTRGPRNGEHSDEVRIMLKVLHGQSTPESCVAALNATNWNVLAAIKLERLQALLRQDNAFVSLEECKTALNECAGDVVKAAAHLRNTDDSAAV